MDKGVGLLILFDVLVLSYEGLLRLLPAGLASFPPLGFGRARFGDEFPPGGARRKQMGEASLLTSPGGSQPFR